MSREDLAIIIGILGGFSGIFSLLRDFFDWKWSTSSNFLKRTFVNRWFLLIVAGFLFSTAFWLLYSKIQDLEVKVTGQEEKIASAYATQTAQAVEFANTPSIKEVPVTVILTATPTPQTPTPIPTFTPDISSTVQAAVAVVIAAQPTSTPYPTYTPYPPPEPLPTYTPYPPLPTYTPAPPPKPVEVTVVVTATPTPEPTQPAVLLSPGESWEQDGLVLSMSVMNYDTKNECINTWFKFKNESSQTIIVSGKARDFSAVDNLGQKWQLKVLGERPRNDCPSAGTDAIWEDNLKASLGPGQQLHYFTHDGFAVAFAGSLTDSKVEYLDLTVNGFAGFKNITWRIPVKNR
jgi:hypothetical protein